MITKSNQRRAVVASAVAFALSLATLGAAPPQDAASGASIAHFIEEAVGHAATATSTNGVVSDYVSAASEHVDVRGDGVVDVVGAQTITMSDGLAAVRFPLAGAGISTQSSYTVLFTADGKVANTVELQFTEDGAGGGSLRAWQDTTQIFFEHITAAAAAKNVGDATTLLDAKGSGDWWGELGKCLNNTGVPAWIIALLSGLCGAACVVTFGIACAACLAAVIGISEGVIIACIDYANSHA
ncbi:hypothetical protein ACL9RL_09060 [Plantibacter sp. Mn2098]|uniref:hypothetical protein n=1 Tax=Plantibacter sp. Mn2098 TaxID=3395266 RepID=UPI003BC22CF3